MSTTNLLNIDVEKLFEHHNVSDINQIHKLLQVEVETKREELRVMVGERYRDLLKAADTIFLMKESSESIVDQMTNINANCQNLNEMQLFGFKASTNSDIILNKQLLTFYSTAGQTKLLTNLHSLIWQRLDEEKFFLAAQLFILARHIHTGLQLDNTNEFTNYFPIAQTQWQMLEPFYCTIKKKLLPVLEREDLSADLATDCLLSLYLLEKSTLEITLTTFIEQRSKAYLNSLNSDQTIHRRAKDRVLASLKVLMSTVDLMSRCFVNDGGNHANQGILYYEIEKFSSKETFPTINLVNFEDTEMLATIPDIIAKFKPSLMPPKLAPEVIKKASENWLKSVEAVTNNELKCLIELISSMKTIQDLKKESLLIAKDPNWSAKCQSLHLPSTLDLYKDKYLILINQRIQDIVRQSWSKCINQTFGKIKEMLINSQSRKNSQGNCKEFVYFWTEDFGDIPKSLKQVHSVDKCSNKLLIKTKGFSPEIVAICIEFDNLLQEIFSEMNVLLDETDNKTENKQLLIEFIRSTSEEHTNNLISQIKTHEFTKNTENYAILAKLLLALIDLCPNFKLCLSYNPMTTNDWKETTSDSRNKTNLENWTRVCSLIVDESFLMWKCFCDLLFKEFLTEVMTLNRQQLGLQNILEDFVTWDTISIEEKDEHENTITSAIRIPSQPRINLQQFLFQLIKKLNLQIPQTLPPKVLKHLTVLVIEYFLEHYTAIVNDALVKCNQNFALQLYFDLKFMQIMFTDRDDDRKILETFLKLTNSLKSCIDPFDFELFHSHVGVNIKKCALRMYQELGILIPHSENLHYLSDLKNSSTTTSSLDKDPNVLTLSSCGANSIWFPLLPVVSTDNKLLPTVTSEPDKISLSKSTVKMSPNRKSLNYQQTAAQNYASNVKSGAAAFFGAMGQDWFR